MSRLPRRLSAEERRLWAEIARSVAPLPGRRAEPAESASPDAGKASPVPKHRPSAAAGPPDAPARKAPPGLAPLERRVVRALARGQTRAEATLDLHGMTQAQAHARLVAFLQRSQAAGHGLVLVVTGRGREGDEARGVLRRMVPHWLALPALRGVVLGFQEAGTRQGGAGALYVRLRRPRALA
jgi:DNA-nicking Smr family endonuclease